MKNGKWILISLIIMVLIMTNTKKETGNECALDTFKCVGDYSQICGDFDNDGFLEWPATVNENGNLFCNDGCNLGTGKCNDNSAPSPTSLLPVGQFNSWPNDDVCSFITNINPLSARYKNYLIIVDTVWQPSWISIDVNNDGVKESYGVGGTSTRAAGVIGCANKGTLLISNYNSAGDDIYYLSEYGGVTQDTVYICKYDGTDAIMFKRDYNTANAIINCDGGSAVCNTNADTNCDGCVSDSEFPGAVSMWKNQNGISDSEFPTVVAQWKTQGGC